MNVQREGRGTRERMPAGLVHGKRRLPVGFSLRREQSKPRFARSRWYSPAASCRRGSAGDVSVADRDVRWAAVRVMAPEQAVANVCRRGMRRSAPRKLSAFSGVAQVSDRSPAFAGRGHGWIFPRTARLGPIEPSPGTQVVGAV